MRKKSVILLLIALLILSILFINSGTIISRIYSSLDIASILTSPAYYKEKPVTISGKVVECQKDWYRIADKTGDLMVFYDEKDKAPKLNSFVVTRVEVGDINLLIKRWVVAGEKKRLFSWGGKEIESKTTNAQ